MANASFIAFMLLLVILSDLVQATQHQYHAPTPAPGPSQGPGTSASSPAPAPKKSSGATVLPSVSTTCVAAIIVLSFFGYRLKI
ncbi:conserved hypothetical protein [Ricinus communis]|uniref:Uncharacterized protein n=1 Tax=Ricinus communis TaxID=3988 RepID=B9T6Y8_RICCO|nr:conserved hypothetical protein [Ricinus communis]